MDDTLATMTSSAQLAPVHALSDAQPDASDPAYGKATRRATQQPTQTKEAPGSKAHLVRYDGNVVFIGNDKFPINTLRQKLGNDICLPGTCLWPSRVRQTPLPFVTATASQVMVS
eukprot:6175547-Pleurochrysis_carterae.AAC.1